MKNNGLSFSLIGAAIILCFFCSCKPTPDLTEKELYSIINQVIEDDSLSIYRVCWRFNSIQLTDESSKAFTNEDIVFNWRQHFLFESLKITPGNLKWRPKHSEILKNATVDLKCNSGILYHISFPIISIDRKKILIDFEEDCNCMLGGQGGKRLYEKKNGHWIRTKVFDTWISKNNLQLKRNQFELAKIEKHP